MFYAFKPPTVLAVPQAGPSGADRTAFQLLLSGKNTAECVSMVTGRAVTTDQLSGNAGANANHLWDPATGLAAGLFAAPLVPVFSATVAAGNLSDMIPPIVAGPNGASAQRTTAMMRAFLLALGTMLTIPSAASTGAGFHDLAALAAPANTAGGASFPAIRLIFAIVVHAISSASAALLSVVYTTHPCPVGIRQPGESIIHMYTRIVASYVPGWTSANFNPPAALPPVVSIVPPVVPVVPPVVPVVPPVVPPAVPPVAAPVVPVVPPVVPPVAAPVVPPVVAPAAVPVAVLPGAGAPAAVGAMSAVQPSQQHIVAQFHRAAAQQQHSAGQVRATTIVAELELMFQLVKGSSQRFLSYIDGLLADLVLFSPSVPADPYDGAVAMLKADLDIRRLRSKAEIVDRVGTFLNAVGDAFPGLNSHAPGYNAVPPILSTVAVVKLQLTNEVTTQLLDRKLKGLTTGVNEQTAAVIEAMQQVNNNKRGAPFGGGGGGGGGGGYGGGQPRTKKRKAELDHNPAIAQLIQIAKNANRNHSNASARAAVLRHLNHRCSGCEKVFQGNKCSTCSGLPLNPQLLTATTARILGRKV